MREREADGRGRARPMARRRCENANDRIPEDSRHWVLPSKRVAGAEESPKVKAREQAIRRGATILLYTDGRIEKRKGGIRSHSHR